MSLRGLLVWLLQCNELWWWLLIYLSLLFLPESPKSSRAIVDRGRQLVRQELIVQVHGPLPLQTRHAFVGHPNTDQLVCCRLEGQADLSAICNVRESCPLTFHRSFQSNKLFLWWRTQEQVQFLGACNRFGDQELQIQLFPVFHLEHLFSLCWRTLLRRCMRAVLSFHSLTRPTIRSYKNRKVS